MNLTPENEHYYYYYYYYRSFLSDIMLSAVRNMVLTVHSYRIYYVGSPKYEIFGQFLSQVNPLKMKNKKF